MSLRKPAVTVRATAAADHDAWVPLWRGYLAFYQTELPESVYTTTWQRLMDPAEPMHAALAEVDGQAVGLVHFIEHRSCWSPLNSLYLQDLYAAPELRGLGVGRALIEHVYARAPELGCGKVHWLTHETNLPAMQLYDRIAEKPGFVQYRKNL
jgi:GNAT superfamily N-acetyltransferase